jgi:hypothetical protein
LRVTLRLKVMPLFQLARLPLQLFCARDVSKAIRRAWAIVLAQLKPPQIQLQ